MFIDLITYMYMHTILIYGLFVLINNPGIYRDGVLQLHMLVGLMARSQT